MIVSVVMRFSLLVFCCTALFSANLAHCAQSGVFERLIGIYRNYRCQQALTQRLNEVLKRGVEKFRVCEPTGQCLSNAYELMRLLEASRIEGIDLDDVNVLAIHNSNLAALGDKQEHDILNFKNGIAGNTFRGVENWFFHIVLEYRGRILDLDFRGEATADKRTYFEVMFPTTLSFVKYQNPDGSAGYTFLRLNPIRTMAVRIVAAKAFVRAVQEGGSIDAAVPFINLHQPISLNAFLQP